jgi:TPR repeat protein
MEDLDNAIIFFKSGDFVKSFKLLMPLAQQGNAEAQCILGNIYHLGLGVEQNVTEAIKWYEKSAKQGYAVASNNLAGIYLTGDDNCGIEANSDEAAKWYGISREQGFLAHQN